MKSLVLIKETYTTVKPLDCIIKRKRQLQTEKITESFFLSENQISWGFLCFYNLSWCVSLKYSPVQWTNQFMDFSQNLRFPILITLWDRFTMALLQLYVGISPLKSGLTTLLKFSSGVSGGNQVLCFYSSRFSIIILDIYYLILRDILIPTVHM